MKKSLLALSILFASLGAKAQEPVDYVNPFIGTTNYGATNPGAIAPRGMASVVPFNVAGGDNVMDKDSQWWSMPYLYENTFFTGYTHVNLSGVGCPDLGTVILMPTTGEVKTNHNEYGSNYSNEIAKPGYYSNTLTKYDVKTEVSATTRAGVHKYHFPAGQANVLLNLGLGLTNEQDGMVRVVNNKEIEGFRTVGSFCYNNAEGIYPVYFVIRLSDEADNFGVWKKSNTYEGAEAAWMGHYNGKTRILENYTRPVAGDSIGVYMSYDLKAPKTVEVQVGVSYVSMENARENLNKEVGNKTFNQIAGEANTAWNEVLSTIEVEGGTDDDKTVFYTALYHTLIHPNTFNDVNGEYQEVGSGKIGHTDGTRYTVFSLWDTYRCTHQLFSLLYPEQQLNMVNSMLDMYDENGWLPKWELNSMETFTMVGDPAAAVIADTYLKGIRDFDTEKALEAMLKSANTPNNPLRPGLEEYLKYGYIPTESKVGGCVSTTQEYCISDYAIAQYAKALGNKDLYKEFSKRSMYYKNTFDKSIGFLRPRNADGSWMTPFDPIEGANFQHNRGFIEGNAWQYSFMMPHDPKGLIKLYGGKKGFVEKLQKVFDDGHYDMANEPDINYPYLFNYVAGEEWRTQKTVRELLHKHFPNQPGGISGNDDTGTMSAWVVFSMMGFYPDVPANANYALTSPVFDKVTIHLSDKYYGGNTVVITAGNQDKDHVYIDDVQLNGKGLKKMFISHDDLVKGAELHFELSEKKNK